MSRLLLAEDDADLAALLVLTLGALGHEVLTASNGQAALDLLSGDQHVGVLLLDVMMPGIDGFETARRVRATSQLPIIMLTARGDAIDIVAGLECGADDYVTKPVEPRVLDARIKALLRRASVSHTRPLLEIGSLRIDEAAMTVARDGQPVELTATEFKLLPELARHCGEVLSRHHPARLHGPRASQCTLRHPDYPALGTPGATNTSRRKQPNPARRQHPCPTHRRACPGQLI